MQYNRCRHRGRHDSRRFVTPALFTLSPRTPLRGQLLCSTIDAGTEAGMTANALSPLLFLLCHPAFRCGVSCYAVQLMPTQRPA